MKIIHTDRIDPKSLKLFERDCVYNGLDACVTAEVLPLLQEQLDEHTTQTYAFSRLLQGPILEMNLRGVRIDHQRKQQVIDDFIDKIDYLERQLETIVFEGIGLPKFNWRSNDDLKALFYERLKIPVIKKRGGNPTVDRNALERLEQYSVARPIIAHINSMRELGKKIGFLRTGMDADSRLRTSYNIAGTETGRLSSSLSEFGTGTNLQNIEESLRSIIIADKGMKMAKFDAAQGESRIVGAIEWNLFQDGTYLDTCESGDLHTEVAKLCWPRLDWTGDPRADRELAEQRYYRHYSRRFMCKKIGHGSNYDGKAATLAAQAKVEREVVEDFQRLYFTAFPAHRAWQEYTKEVLLEKGYLVSFTGRKRWFMGLRTDPVTQREAIAFDPQGSLADIVNRAMINIWLHRTGTLYANDHDALTIQYPEEMEDEVIPQLQEQLRQPIELEGGRIFEIPYDCRTGWNKGEYCCGQNPKCKGCEREVNPDGLKEYKPNDERSRTQEVPILDRVFHRVHR